MGFVNFLDVLLLGFYVLSAFLIIKRSWFYSFYQFSKFLLLLVVSFFLAKFCVAYNPSVLNLSDLHFYLLAQIILFGVLWYVVRFQKLFIFINRKTINLDQFVFLNHLNTYLNYLPSLVVAFFVTFTFFTIILSFSAGSPMLQAMIENSYAKEVPYKIYFATNINGSSLFNNILYKTPETAVNEAPAEVETIPAEAVSNQQAMINEQREQVGLEVVTPEVIYSTPPPELTMIFQPIEVLAPASGTISIPVTQPTEYPSPTPEAAIPEHTSEPEETTEPTPTPSPEPEPQIINIEALEMQLFALINEQRIQNNLTPFQWDPALAAVARAHSIDMDRRDFFDHDNPDGLNPFQRMKLGGINYKKAAENIVGTQTPELMIKSWMNSEGHRKNILNPSYNKTGVGISENKKYGLLGTQTLTN